MDIQWRPVLCIQHDLRGRSAPHILCYLRGEWLCLCWNGHLLAQEDGTACLEAHWGMGSLLSHQALLGTWLLSVIVFKASTRSSECMLLDEGRGCTDGNLVVWGQGCKAKKRLFCSAWGLVLLFIFAQVYKQLRDLPDFPSLLLSLCPVLPFISSSLSLHLHFFSFS